MQIHASASRLWNDVAGPNIRPVASDPDLLAQTASTLQPVLPDWITDTFAAKYATRILIKAGNTAVGQIIQTALADPFLMLNTHLRVGGWGGSIAAASASIAASGAPNRKAGTIIGAAVGAFTGASQAMMTLPNPTTIAIGALHGVVRGATAGNVAVFQQQLHSQAKLRPEQRLW